MYKKRKIFFRKIRAVSNARDDVYATETRANHSKKRGRDQSGMLGAAPRAGSTFATESSQRLLQVNNRTDC
ncbi:hypothetical protein B9Z55_025201 [Caenorhabditis nigoni]|uniref:Uncharacterized protein n=1 Tax=Caenorhabditis nigoni TaxID=1611254 RepID=A0A2G5SXZ8_9PELO|nr:hypothetical protein B9Z55_025201 [Caenorhabditis nigoni]